MWPNLLSNFILGLHHIMVSIPTENLGKYAEVWSYQLQSRVLKEYQSLTGDILLVQLSCFFGDRPFYLNFCSKLKFSWPVGVLSRRATEPDAAS